MTKWASNSEKVVETTFLRDRAPTRVLGTSWNLKDDILMFSNASSILTDMDPETKRSLISLYLLESIRSYGLADSISDDSKVAVSRIVDWAQPLDADIENSWETRKHEIAIKVPRWLLRNLSSVDKVELHGFGDASKRAYGRGFKFVLRIRMATKS